MSIKSQNIKSVNTKTIDLNKKLSSLNVRKIIQDKNGFLWVSTQDGLNRYDGNNILKFTVDNVDERRRLIGADCYCMDYKQNDNFLYVINGYEGINKIDINNLTVVKKISSKKLLNTNEQEWLKRIIRFKDYLIINTPRKIILYNTQKDETEKVEILITDNNKDISFIVEVNDILFLFVSNGELIQYDLLKRVVINKSSLFQNVTINNIVFYKENIWLSTDKGVKVYNTNTNSLMPNENFFGANEKFTSNTTCIYFNNDFQYISNNDGLYKKKFKENVFDLVTPSISNNNGNDFKNLNTIISFENSLYTGGAYGVSEIKNIVSPFSSFYKDIFSGNAIEHNYNLKNNYSDKILACTDDGSYLINVAKRKIEKFYENDLVISGQALSTNEFILSGSKGLFYSKNKILEKASKIFKELLPIQNELMICIEKLNKNTFIFASQLQNGMFIWNTLNHTLVKINKSTTTNFNDLLINRILKIDDENLIVVSETEVYKFNFNTQECKIVFKKKNLNLNNSGVFMDICKQGSNYYIGTYGLGLIKLDTNFNFKQLISTKDGINNIGIYRVFSFNDSLVAITTNNGFSIYNSKNNFAKNYFQEDGLHSNAFEETSGFQQGDSIFAGGIKGFTIFDTKKYTTNSIAPKLYFDNITINTSTNIIDTTNLFLQKLEIPNNYIQAKISFVGLNYQNPTRVNYWYRITELGTNWIDLKNQNFIDLIGISPGKYHLEVKAANEDGVECAPIKMELHFLPKWYQTLLFKILLALLVAGLLYVLYSFRIKQLKKVLAVRQKISQNLHDDIGSTLSAINMYTQVAKLQPQENHFLNSIEENTKDVLGKLDDIIWSTNPKNDKVQNLVERMDAFARPLCNAHNIKFIFEQNNIGTTQKISEAIRQNIFIVFKEAINNALKYAQCKNITVVLEEKNKNIACSITDDGIGFEPSKPTERNGLLNMQLRAKELKGICTIASELKKGSVVFIQLPL